MGADGGLLYAVPCRPQALPPVTPAALRQAWDIARAAATAERWGPHRSLAFEDGTLLALADADAACWAEALDRAVGLDRMEGLALCLRLLALVDLLGRARWLAGLFAIDGEGIELHPALLSAAALQPLDAGGRFPEAAMRQSLSRRLGQAAG